MIHYQRNRLDWLKRTHAMSPRHWRKRRPIWLGGKLCGGCGSAPDTWRVWLSDELGAVLSTSDRAFSDREFVRVRIRPWVNHRDRLAMTRRGKWMVNSQHPPCQDECCCPTKGLPGLIRRYRGSL